MFKFNFKQSAENEKRDTACRVVRPIFRPESLCACTNWANTLSLVSVCLNCVCFFYPTPMSKNPTQIKGDPPVKMFTHQPFLSAQQTDSTCTTKSAEPRPHFRWEEPLEHSGPSPLPDSKWKLTADERERKIGKRRHGLERLERERGG